MTHITIYTTPTCVYCKLAKEYLQNKGLPYVEKDVASDAAARDEMIAKSGQMGVPVIMVSGQTVVGFDKEKLEVLLAGHSAEITKGER